MARGHVGEPVQDRGERRGIFQSDPLGGGPAGRACAARRSKPPWKTPGWPWQTSMGWRHIRSCRRRGTRMVDGISIVSVNCMMAMLKLPNLSWHVQVETVNIGGAVQQAVNALLAGRLQVRGGLARDAQPQGHLPEPARHLRPGRGAVHRAVRLRRSGTGHGGRVHALAGAAQPEPGEDGHARRDAAQARATKIPTRTSTRSRSRAKTT